MLLLASTLRLTLAIWLGLSVFTFGLVALLGTIVSPIAPTLAIAIVFCGTCGAWMAFGGGHADRESAWILMLGWGVVAQLVAPIIALLVGLDTTGPFVVARLLVWGIILPSAITVAVMLFALRSWRAACGPVVGAIAVIVLFEMGVHPLRWGLPVWMMCLSVGLCAWALHTRSRFDAVQRGRICGHCGYDLSGLSDPTCPECGQPSRSAPRSFVR